MGTSRSTITPTSDSHEGIIARSVDKIFDKIEDMKIHYEFKVQAAFVELYKEQLYDLLSDKDDNVVDIREDPRNGVYIANLTEVPVESPEAMFSSLVKGSSKRATAATAMNSVSSRSHAIFTINIEGSRREASANECSDDMPDSIKTKFHLVDLAGSERAKKTLATGERYKEGVSINLGLFCLGNVIAALGDDNGPKGHISYRDSKLTRLLQDSLGGNSHTLMIACVSPADSNIEETLSTLRYADRARKIKNKPIVNRGDTKEEVVRLRREIQDLRLQMLQGSGGGGLSDIEARELIDLRETAARLLKENKELTSALSALQTTFVSPNDQSQDVDVDDPDDKEHALQQARLANQLATLNDVLAQKEQIASTMMANEEKIKEIREKYEKSLASMQEELATLQQEKDKLDHQTKTSKNDPSCKLSEQRRKRIQELEVQMNDLRKKVAEQSKALKINERNEKKAKLLQEEIGTLKTNKVRLMKQMKEDAEKNRAWKQEKEKEVQKLKQAERKQQVKIAKMENIHVKQQNVMKRKMEEAVQANKRLQDVITKQKNARKMKGAQAGKTGLLGAAERVKTLVNHEIDVATSVKDAIQSREQLMKDRAELSKQLNDLRSKTRVTLLASERHQVDKEKKKLQSELDLRNTEIANLQKQIMDAKQNEGAEGSNNWWESMASMAEAKYAMQYLFEKTTDAMSVLANVTSEKTDLKHMFNEAAANVRTLEDEIVQLKSEKDNEVLKLTKDFEEQRSVLLSKLANPDFEVKEAEMLKLSQFHSKLKQTMKKSKKPVRRDDEDDFVLPETSEEEDEGSADEMDDPDWQQTPLFRRIKRVKETLKPNDSRMSRTGSASDLKQQSGDNEAAVAAARGRPRESRAPRTTAAAKTAARTKCVPAGKTSGLAATSANAKGAPTSRTRRTRTTSTTPPAPCPCSTPPSTSPT